MKYSGQRFFGVKKYKFTHDYTLLLQSLYFDSYLNLLFQQRSKVDELVKAIVLNTGQVYVDRVAIFSN